MSFSFSIIERLFIWDSTARLMRLAPIVFSIFLPATISSYAVIALASAVLFPVACPNTLAARLEAGVFKNFEIRGCKREKGVVI